MMTSFRDAFGKETGMNKDIPAEVLELLNDDLPDNFMYIKDKDGNYMATPRPDMLDLGLRITTQFDFDKEADAQLVDRLKSLPQEKWPEYLYRLQRAFPIKDLRIGNEEKVVPIEKTMGNPLQETETTIIDCKVYPQRFPEPITVVFESTQGDMVSIKIQQQAYDNLAEIKFQNVDFPALSIEIYHYAPLVDNISHEKAITSMDAPFRLTYSVKPTKAHTVRDAIAALHIFKGLFDGTAKINGQIIAPKGGKSTLDSQQIDDALDFWSTALKLEEILDVSFRPDADFPIEDVRFFDELNSCFIDGKEIIWKHPFSHFHMGGYQPTDKKQQLEDFIGKEGISYKFVEGPIPVTLLGAEFSICSRTEMQDFIITNIKWDDADKKSCEVYIANAPGKTWTLSRMYVTEGELSMQE